MNPQTIAEGNRILGIVDDLMEDLEVLAVLPHYQAQFPNKDLTHLHNSFGDQEGALEVDQQLEEHFNVERSLESQTNSTLSAPELADLHFSTRALIDTLKSAGYPNRYKASFAPSASVLSFVDIVKTFRDVLADRFKQTVDEDAVKFSILHDTVNRERNASADVQALMRELHNEKELRRTETDRRSKTIAALRQDTDQVAENADKDREAADQEAEQRERDAKERYQQAYEDLEKQVEQLQKELEDLENKCQTNEFNQRALRNKKELQLQNIIDTYDKNMTELDQRKRDLTLDKTEKESELRDVEEHLGTLRTEAEAHAQEMRLEMDRQTHKGEIEDKLAENAKMIQALYRSYAVRLHAAQKGKKKGKGKKK